MDQIERIGLAIKELEKTESKFVLSAIKILLFTGRTGEILTLKWNYIDFKNSKMNLPDTKTGKKIFSFFSYSTSNFIFITR